MIKEQEFINENQQESSPKLWHIHRRLYNWVLHWAHTPYGVPALFIIAFVESSFFPIPPDVLLVALVLGARSKWAKFAFTCTAGSVAGGLFGYFIGYELMDTVGQKIIAMYHAEEYYKQVMELYGTYDYWIVFVAAFSPIPYKVFTIASGVFQMNIPGFFLVSLVGRGARFFLVSILLWKYGQTIKDFIDKYFDILSLLFVALLVGGFLLVSFL